MSRKLQSQPDYRALELYYGVELSFASDMWSYKVVFILLYVTRPRPDRLVVICPRASLLTRARRRTVACATESRFAACGGTLALGALLPLFAVRPFLPVSAARLAAFVTERRLASAHGLVLRALLPTSVVRVAALLIGRRGTLAGGLVWGGTGFVVVVCPYTPLLTTVARRLLLA